MFALLADMIDKRVRTKSEIWNRHAVSYSGFEFKLTMSSVKLGNITFSNDQPFVLLGGINVLEDQDFVLDCAGHYKSVCEKLKIPLVFKASYDKANRSSIYSFRGPGLEEGMRILQAVKDTHNIPVITDVHSPEEANKAAVVADIIQLPAFLARQTDPSPQWQKQDLLSTLKSHNFLAHNKCETSWTNSASVAMNSC